MSASDPTARVIASARRCVAMYDSFLTSMNDTRPDWLDEMREGLAGVEQAHPPSPGPEPTREIWQCEYEWDDAVNRQRRRCSQPKGHTWDHSWRPPLHEEQEQYRIRDGALNLSIRHEKELEAKLRGSEDIRHAEKEILIQEVAKNAELKQQLADAQAARDAVFDEAAKYVDDFDKEAFTIAEIADGIRALKDPMPNEPRMLSEEEVDVLAEYAVSSQTLNLIHTLRETQRLAGELCDALDDPYSRWWVEGVTPQYKALRAVLPKEKS